jgi:hypothetical protein
MEKKMKKNRPIDKFYKTIENAQKKIDAIRKNCKHKKTHMGLYSWRIGAMDNAELCNTCDAVIPNSKTIFGGWQSNALGDNATSITVTNPLVE